MSRTAAIWIIERVLKEWEGKDITPYTLARKIEEELIKGGWGPSLGAGEKPKLR